MKINLKTWQLALVLLLSALLPVLLIVSMTRTTNAQMQTADLRSPKQEVGICKGNHRSRKEFYKSVRMLPPSTVLEIVGNRLNYATADEGIELGSVELENGYSVVPKDFSATSHSGCYGITFCEIHKVALLIDSLPATQCGLSKQ